VPPPVIHCSKKPDPQKAESGFGGGCFIKPAGKAGHYLAAIIPCGDWYIQPLSDWYIQSIMQSATGFPYFKEHLNFNQSLLCRLFFVACKRG